MLIRAYQTKKVLPGDNLEEILDTSLPHLEENSVVAITSKIVSITQGNIVPINSGIDKEMLVRQQAEKIMVDESEDATFKVLLTITNNILAPWAGIDESNSNGNYILWPTNPLKKAEDIWSFLRKTHSIQNLGVLIIDSTFIPLRTGSISIGLAWCGFKPVKSYIGKPDIFGEPLKYTTTSLVDSMSVAAGMCMGEGNEQKPLVMLQDVPEIEFVNRPPSDEEKKAMYYPLEKGLYGPLLKAATWETGQNKAKDNS